MANNQHSRVYSLLVLFLILLVSSFFITFMIDDVAFNSFKLISRKISGINDGVRNFLKTKVKGLENQTLSSSVDNHPNDMSKFEKKNQSHVLSRFKGKNQPHDMSRIKGENRSHNLSMMKNPSHDMSRIKEKNQSYEGDNSSHDMSRNEGLKFMGYESVDRHAFKSPFIVDPGVYNENSTSATVLPKQGKKKIISLYHVNRNAWFKLINYNADFEKCPYKCELDFNDRRTQVADLLIFICRGSLVGRLKRPEGQLWGILCWESGRHWSYPDYGYWKDKFNITLGYRLDAHINIPYVKLAWRDSSLLFKEEYYREIARNKTKTAVWIVSNCQADRMSFVKEMQKYIDVDIYGRCGKKLDPICRSMSEGYKCLRMFNTTYKFYLSFENSFCQDYVTEKLQKTFLNRSHIIPVVKGALDYDTYFPQNTFVNGNKIKKAKDLALYLMELGNDLPRYSKMLQEKDRLSAVHYIGEDWCKICESLHIKTFGMIKNIKHWSHDNTCRAAEY